MIEGEKQVNEGAELPFCDVRTDTRRGQLVAAVFPAVSFSTSTEMCAVHLRKGEKVVAVVSLRALVVRVFCFTFLCLR